MDYATLFPFWNQLTEAQKAAISDACYTETHKKGDLMHRSNENCKGLMTVLSGQLRTYIVSEEGREVTLFRVYQGDVCVLSASCLLDSIDFDVMIEATENTEVLILPTLCLNAIMKENPHAELFLYKTATEKFSDVMWTMQQILFRKIDQRLSAFLLEEMHQHSTTDLRLTHEEIATYIGSAREVVSKVLKYLAETGAITLGRGSIHIKDESLLKNLS